ncbi:MAG: hypothetical protein LBC68_08095 [Prevotellaceae bacterium]|jgi:hypothetical protein|nr:hypothetical protein [Prevotellaceae bacterium]
MTVKEYIVLKRFADKDNFAKKYEVGDKLPTDISEERIANMIKLGIVKAKNVEVKDVNSNVNNPATGNTNTNSNVNNPATDIDMTGKAVDIIEKVEVFTDVEKLKQYLEEEKSSTSPRATVMKAIEGRIESLMKQGANQ